MGNAVAKRFDLPKDHTATAGHVSNFKIWPAKNKETQQLVSLWAFDKGEIMKRKDKPVTDKSIAEQLFQIMKKDLTLMRECSPCSAIVQVLEVVEESKTALVFTTERIVCSLADVLNNCENVPGGLADHLAFFDAEKTVSEMEISRGLLNIAGALQYLHSVQRKLHLNIAPESIVITESGQWKLCGFGFNLSFEQGEQQKLASPYFLKAFPSAVHNSVTRLEPDLRYASPECTDGGMNPPGVRSLTPVADLFSLGVVFYEAYRFNMKLTSYERSFYRATVPVTHNDVNQHHLALQVLHKLEFSFLPTGVQQLLNGLLNLNPQLRISTNQLMNHSHYTSGALAVLNTIDVLHTKDLGTKSSQMISLQHQLSDFPARVLMHSIMPRISFLCIAEPQLWVYALPIHVYVQRLLPGDQYKNRAHALIAKGLAVADCNECIQAFLANVEFIARTFGKDFFQANASILFCNALEKHNVYLQNLAFEKLAEPEVFPNFEAAILSERVIPQLCKEACKHPEAAVKTQALYVLSLLIQKLDEQFIADNILPSLKYINDHEKNPAVSMCVVGNYEAISNTLGPEYLATSILPVIQGMLLDRGLDRQQFEMLVNMVKRMLKRILTIRTNELGIPPISVAEVPGSDRIDPFEAAKELIASSKRKNQANNYGMGSVRSKEPPPPVPSMPPPPPPGGAPPVPMIPPAPLPVAATAVDVRQMSLGGVTLQSAVTGGITVAAATSETSLPMFPPPVPAVPPVASLTSPTSSIGSTGLLGTIDPIGLDILAGNTSQSSSSATTTAVADASDSSKQQKKSWFSFSGSAKPPAEKVAEYSPPVAPTTSAAATIPDMDDFLESFGKRDTGIMSTAASNSSTAATAAAISYAPPIVPLNAAPTVATTATTSTASSLSIEDQIRQTQQEIARLNGSLTSSVTTTSLPTKPTPVATAAVVPIAAAPSGGSVQQQGQRSSVYAPPVVSSTAASAASGLNFAGMQMHSQPTMQQHQQQHQQQQQQQQQSTQAASGYYPNQVPRPIQQQQTIPSQQMNFGQFNNMPIQQQQQLSYGMQYGQQQQQLQQPRPMQGYPSMNPGYGHPTAMHQQQYNHQQQQQYQQQQQQQYQQQQRFYGGGGAVAAPPSSSAAAASGLNTSRIGNLPAQTGYQPPLIPPPPAQQQQQQNRRASVDSAFDFLG